MVEKKQYSHHIHILYNLKCPTKKSNFEFLKKYIFVYIYEWKALLNRMKNMFETAKYRQDFCFWYLVCFIQCKKCTNDRPETIFCLEL